MSTANEPDIRAYIGASGSGKGVSITRELEARKPARLLIWDPRDEYGKFAPKVVKRSDLVRRFEQAGAGPVRARFVAGDDLGELQKLFGSVCRLAFEAGGLLLLAEELSDVTSASRAPPEWRRIITQGRHRGLQVIGAAQRPALIDKNFLGACTYVRCFTLRYAEDRRAMAKSMDVPERDIAELQTTKTARGVTIRYLEKDFRAGRTESGEIRLMR